MSNTKARRQRMYRVITSAGLWQYKCQVKRLGLWWTIGASDYEDRAKDQCKRHAQAVIWEGMLP